MLDVNNITQIGIGGAQIAGIVIVVKYFIGFITIQEKNFTKIVGNHINHNTKSNRKLEKTNVKLVSAIDSLLVFLKEKNK